jgi:hypothetical protein
MNIYTTSKKNKKMAMFCFVVIIYVSRTPLGNWLSSYRGVHKSQGCKVTANDYTNLQAVQQILSNAETDPGDVYGRMKQSLSDPRHAPLAYMRDGAILHLKSKQSLNSSIKRHRRLSQPKSCQSLSELDLLLNCTTHGDLSKFSLYGLEFEKFIYHKEGLGPSSDLCLIFTCRYFLHLMYTQETIYFDGTFKVVPSLFRNTLKNSQFVSISIVLKGADDRKQLFPLLFALLPGKSEPIYESFFSLVKGFAAEDNEVCQ